MPTKYDLILSYEDSFARAAAVGVIVRRPLSVWHVLIPFAFIFDFMQRKKETEMFSRNFLFIKKLALDAAFNISEGEDRKGQLSRIEHETKEKLTAQKLYSWGIHQGQMKELNFLIDHYLKLLKPEGNSYRQLVKNVYQTREGYEAFFHQLSSIEKEVDRAVIETLGGTEEIQQRILAKQEVIAEMRSKRAYQLFGEAKES